MKICYLSNSAIPSTVASSIQIVKMCEAFSELKNNVLLITTNVKKKNDNIFKYYNVKNKFIIKRIKVLRNSSWHKILFIFNIFYS